MATSWPPGRGTPGAPALRARAQARSGQRAGRPKAG
eukprot:CAMPEP_0203956672 /NCGR_PEP_ID=MMETSP0359-20131031/88846_1 /ASSEMBLY_ACC=CAM_ASM_000338 /TAXON_ID=268821 /ORGANISM="Scrippsiella Hangoei, Strain SHTV-5" /LENGTH=35 /DNA_ID= /DNA_START= /DNA_END= /DNA_ORIENTATION=